MAKSSEMPEPQVLNYELRYRVTPLFINDLKKVMADVAYVDAKKVFDKINEHGGILTAAALNELIRDISSFPYKHVSGIMSVIYDETKFGKYFETLVPQKKVQEQEKK